jgi:hypothetical protein
MNLGRYFTPEVGKNDDADALHQLQNKTPAGNILYALVSGRKLAQL